MHNVISVQLQKCKQCTIAKETNHKTAKVQNCKITKLQILNSKIHNSKINKYKILNPKFGITNFRIPEFKIFTKIENPRKRFAKICVTKVENSKI